MPRQSSSLTARGLAAFLDRALRPERFEDASLNGLQVEGRGPVCKVAVAVDATLATFSAARAAGAGLLIVHHGLFWGESRPLTGAHYERIRLLVEAGLGLYASHLPLDRHPTLGNNARLARALGLGGLRPFGRYHGQLIGWGGALAAALATDALAARLAQATGSAPRILPFGPRRLRRVAVVSGGAGDLALQAAEAGYDAFITGEMSHSGYAACQEAGITVFLGGHYATETLGVLALAELIRKKYSLPTVFLDFPTGL